MYSHASGTGSGAALADEPRQVGAVDELHLVVVRVADLVGVEHLHHVGVLHLGERLDLVLEARLGRGVLELLLADDLERHVAAQARVVGLVDAAHAALAEQFEEDVAPEREVAAVPLEDLLDLERGEPPAAIEFARHALHVGLVRAATHASNSWS